MRYHLARLVKGFAKAAGYEIRRSAELPQRVPGIRHAVIFPVATYCPWLGDEDFEDVYDRIRSHTLVDQYRCYELWQLVGEAAKLGKGQPVEIGVWRGGTGALIAHRWRAAGMGGRVYLCDTFKGVVKAGPLDAGYSGGEHHDTSKEMVLQLCNLMNLDQVEILEGVFPEESAGRIVDQQFCLCHVDVDVYESARDIVDWIWPRLVPGGIIVFDDYGFYTCAGITRFVNDERCKVDRIVIHNLNGHGIIIKIDRHNA
jgi:O-methyltransferase